MRMDIEIDDNELQKYIRHYIDRAIEDRINFYLQHQLKGAVERKLAEMRLLSSNSQAIDGAVEATLSDLVNRIVADTLPGRVRQMLLDRL